MIMRDVAHLAAVSPTTLYNLYNTKDELVLEALQASIADSWIRAEQTAELGFDRLMAQLALSIKQTKEHSAYALAMTQALLRAQGNDSAGPGIDPSKCAGCKSVFAGHAEQA